MLESIYILSTLIKVCINYKRHVECVGKEEKCIHIFGGETKLPLGRYRLISEDNIKVDLGVI
jgi:predicted nucleic acid-binding Zn finger protein